MSQHHDNTFNEWVEWIERIEADINRQQVTRYFFALLNDMWKNNPDLPPSVFPDFFAAMYAESQGASVRRLVDMDTRSLSLTLLLKEIAENPEAISKSRFLKMQGASEDPEDILEKHLYEWAAGVWQDSWGGGDSIDPSILEDDLNTLVEKAEIIRTWVNKYVAHADRSGLEDLPTFDDLHESVKAIFECFGKYHALLAGAERTIKVPIFQYNQLRFFELPWLKEGHEPPEPEKLVGEGGLRNATETRRTDTQ